MPAIGILVKPASGNCNMHCDYCFYCDETSKRSTASYGMMSEATLRNVIKRTLMRADGSYSIAFQGGEPTLRGLDFYRQVVSMANRYNRNHAVLNYSLQTNGYNIDEKWAQFFAENHFLIGLSVDGTERIHNHYRHVNGHRSDGDNSYQRVLRASRILDRYHVEYNILTVVHRETADNIKEIYKDYRKRNWNYLQFISCLDPLDEEHGKTVYSLSPKLYGKFLCDLFDLWYADYQKGNAPYIRQFENYVGILLGIEPEACEQRGVCGKQIVVEADGSVYPCDFYVLDGYTLGNFNTDLLPTIDENRRRIGFREVCLECRNCKWFSLCRCACYRSRIPAPDGSGHINYFCNGYLAFFEYSYDRLREVAARLRPLQ